MKLLEWINQQGITQAKFSAVIGVTPGTVSKWVRSGNIPKPPQMKKIEEVTRKKVTAQDFYSDSR